MGKGARLDRDATFDCLCRDLNVENDECISTEAHYIVQDLIDKGVNLAMRDTDGFPIPSASGIWTDKDDDGSGCIAWALYNLKDLPSDLDLNDEKDLAFNLTGWCYHYSGPGRSFSNEPFFEKRGSRILVKQFRGLDI